MAEKAAETLTRDEKIAQAKELYSRGSRNYLVKLYEEAADDLSQVCSLYSELHGELSNELGMPYLLYAKSLIALALEENKVIDVPEEDEGDDDDDENVDGDEGNDEADGINEANENTKADGNNEDNDKKDTDKVKDEEEDEKEKKSNDEPKISEVPVEIENNTEKSNVNDKKMEDDALSGHEEQQTKAENLSSKTNGTTTIKDNEIEVMPSTSNGIVEGEEDTAQDNDDEADEAATNLQVAWETLELAARIFENQGESALPNLAEVYIELANIEFENNLMKSARDDFNKALEIYKNLSINYRRPMAEIYYKMGLSYLMEQSLQESANNLKKACKILDEEINEMKNKDNPTDKDKLNLQDMEETKQEIWVKITEIEESMQQCMSEVRAAIQNHMNPDPKCGESSTSSSSSSSAVAIAATASSSKAGASSSSSSSTLSSASASIEKPKPTDISHLIKRKKPDTPTIDQNDMSPAKRPAT